MQLRVRSLDGAELALEVPPLTVRVGVAEIKRRSICEFLRLRAVTDVAEDATESDDMERRMANSCLAFRGQLLADADDVNLFALAPSDFFVLIEETEEDDDDDGGDEETKQSEPVKQITHHKHRGKRDVIDSEPTEAVVMQLVEMGFDREQAHEATQLARGELSSAIALLMGEADPSTLQPSTFRDPNRLQVFVHELIRRYPGLAAIESLLRNEEVHRFKQVVRTNELEALVMLKEAFPPHWMAQMNENPSATALFLAVPEQFETEDDVTPRKSAKKTKVTHEVDLTDETAPTADTRTTTHQDAIDRLTTMGFDRDLVAAIYESCGENEELAANMLFDTLQ